MSQTGREFCKLRGYIDRCIFVRCMPLFAIIRHRAILISPDAVTLLAGFPSRGAAARADQWALHGL